MKRVEKYKVHFVNLLIAVGISLIVNFSYFVLMIESRQGTALRPPGPPWMEISQRMILLQLAYFIALSFILLTIVTFRRQRGGALASDRTSTYLKRIGLCTLITVALYFLAPITYHHREWGYGRFVERIGMVIACRRLLDPMLVLKCSFTLIVAALYGQIYRLVYQRQRVVIENQALRNENLQAQYNVLVGQINPHFFFNALNTLSMLVREIRNEDALTYIDRLSDTFRYIIQSSRHEMSTLREEIEFLHSYKYIFEIRYGDKLSFDIEVNDRYSEWTLPTLSLQPLIENAVKHNTITRSRPLQISIQTQGAVLVVSNPVAPKLDSESTGIGLYNLSRRYRLLTQQDIVVEHSDSLFTVILPLTAPNHENTDRRG